MKIQRFCFFVLFLTLMLAGCAGLINRNVMSKQIPSELGSLSAKPGSNESVLQVKRGDMFGESVIVSLDGEKILVLGLGEEGRCIIPNGEHIISAELNPAQKVKSVFYKEGQKEISAYSSQILITAIVTAQNGVIGINMEEIVKPGINRPNPNPDLEGPLNNAAKVLVGSLQQGNSKIAIVNVSSADLNQSEFVAGELEYILVSNKFSVVDRSDLDRIRQEQQLQVSGEVGDDSIVSIGKFTGANVVITGSITGEGSSRRLRLRALSTQTGEVLGVASEKF
jgi:PBP1b-binding outer membrane lipoprotein LpoB